ncbi:hypothetical protein AN963_04980 [Brevibacillus choshinensis]|uniref:Helicase XPB/Ssl2 N-terminal domain-containing protein n=1 Tax=Brevibacillus choshinensis TaxID=54911 RepID=A0ABR5NC64_BRECH|nr:hypothetical protein [Brevibacillus choshinensis]KQL49128.1 hypothetical protein AN963_04980 [Brevibacillus choshinensis]
MRVQDSLEYLSETTQRAIMVEQTNRFGLADDQDLFTRLQDPNFLERVWDQSTEIEREVMKRFVIASTRGFFSKRSWERMVSSDQRHMAVGLTRLRRLGIIMTVRKMWSEIGYLMPQEIREEITAYLLPEPSRAFVSLSKTLPYYITAGRGIHLDLFGLLLFIRDNQVPVTQKGTIHRRMSLRIAAVLSLSDEHCAGLTLPPLDQEEREGLALTVALDLAMRLGLIHIENKVLSIRPQEVRRWMAQSPPDRWQQTYECVVQQYLSHGDWWEAFALLMRKVPLDRWSSLEEQMRMLEEAGFTLPTDADKLIVEKWLHLLTGMGWIQLGIDGEERLFWRWNSLPHLTAEEGWFVDPAGALTIPPLVPLLRVWEISRFCTLHFDGPLIRGEVQAKELQSFLASGRSEEQVIELLSSACAHPLPEALVESIHHWAKTARQIQIEPYYRVRTAHSGFIEEWKEIPDFQPFLSQIISPTDFLISLSQESKLVALLREYGYEPQVLARTIDSLEPTDNKIEVKAPVGWFVVERPWDGYAMENTFPDPLEGMKEVASLPKMWTQHFQSYHPQSLRDLLKRASELQLEVELQQAGKDKLRGLPSEVRVEMGYWTVTLAQESGKARYRLDEIARVRIVVPDYLYDGV